MLPESFVDLNSYRHRNIVAFAHSTDDVSLCTTLIRDPQPRTTELYHPFPDGLFFLATPPYCAKRSWVGGISRCLLHSENKVAGSGQIEPLSFVRLRAFCLFSPMCLCEPECKRQIRVFRKGLKLD